MRATYDTDVKVQGNDINLYFSNLSNYREDHHLWENISYGKNLTYQPQWLIF